MPDILGPRLKIGSLIPAANSAIEPEFASMAVPGVTHLASRLQVKSLPFTSADNAEAVLRSAIDDLVPALQRLQSAAPDIVVMGMAAPCFWGGRAGETTIRQTIEANTPCPVVMPNQAMTRALDALSAKTVGIVTPEIAAVDDQIAAWFRTEDYGVNGIVGLNAKSPEDVINLDEQRITAALDAVDDSSVDAVLLVGTSLASARLVPALEQRIGKPVIPMNVALWWATLRQAGINDRIPGYGQLLAAF